MSKFMDLANAQMALDRDRENVEATARKLFSYCAALRERIARYYGTMATAKKHAAFVAQRTQLLMVMDACSEYIRYAQEEEAWSNLDYAPESKPLAELDAVARREKLPSPDVVGAMQEMNDLIQKGDV